MLDFPLLMGKVGEGDRGKTRVEEQTQGNKATSQPSPLALKKITNMSYQFTEQLIHKDANYAH